MFTVISHKSPRLIYLAVLTVRPGQKNSSVLIMIYSALLDKAAWKLQIPRVSFDNEGSFNIYESESPDNENNDDDNKLVHKVVNGVLEQAKNESFLLPLFVSNNRVKRTPRYISWINDVLLVFNDILASPAALSP